MKNPLHVLFVEDCEDDMLLIVDQLHAAGYALDSERVESESGMRNKLRERPWDIVISDYSMPTFSAIGALRVLQESGLDLPFIIVSGTVGEEVAVEALKNGAHDFISKFNLARLVTAVEREINDVVVRQERKVLKEQLVVSDRMATIGMLGAGVAHEINNPLTAVVGNIQLAQEVLQTIHEIRDPDHPAYDLHDLLHDAAEAANRIRGIAADLKIFSRASEDKTEPTNVMEVLESSIRIANNEIRHRARLTKDLASVPLVEANGSRLGQVFLNLLVNAAQAIPEGRYESNEIRVATHVSADNHVVVEITDTGAGMSPETLQRLFTPFFTTKPVGVGTGLGLSICQRIIMSIGGKITVESSVGEGSTFRILLPIGSEQRPNATDTSKEQGVETKPRRGQVLVIDDDALIVKVVMRTLGASHDVTAFNSANDALAAFRAGTRFDVILCDVMMPDVSGIDFFQELCLIAKDQCERVVFLTGGVFAPESRNFLAGIGNLQVAKPFQPKMLQLLVASMLEEKKPSGF